MWRGAKRRRRGGSHYSWGVRHPITTSAPGSEAYSSAIAVDFSRTAAAVNSQGRKPLVSIQLDSRSPNGATVLSPRWGFDILVPLRTRGLHPWLLTVGPLGLHADE